jgi:hypothetical protein
MGDLEQAIKWEEKAVQAATNPQERSAYMDVLEQFRSERRN